MLITRKLIVNNTSWTNNISFQTEKNKIYSLEGNMFDIALLFIPVVYLKYNLHKYVVKSNLR